MTSIWIWSAECCTPTHTAMEKWAMQRATILENNNNLTFAAIGCRLPIGGMMECAVRILVVLHATIHPLHFSTFTTFEKWMANASSKSSWLSGKQKRCNWRQRKNLCVGYGTLHRPSDAIGYFVGFVFRGNAKAFQQSHRQILLPPFSGRMLISYSFSRKS